MDSPLAEEEMNSLIPALAEVSKAIAAGGHLDQHELEKTLISVGVQVAETGFEELERFSRILRKTHDTMDPNMRTWAVEALKNRGVPDFPARLAVDRVLSGKRTGELPKEGDRSQERSVLVSLHRTKCPFCAHDIARFRNCRYCGQGFVWANVLMEHGESS